MKGQLEKILSVSYEQIEKSSKLTLLLLSIYSKLFLNGSQPSTCSKCMRDYYKKIVQEGLKKIEFMEKKTNVLKEGLHFVRPENKDFTNANLSDEKAIELLDKGLLKPSQFNTLPKGWEPKQPPIDLEEKNKGKFTLKNLEPLNGNLLMQFAEKVTEEKPTNKKKAIENILDWNKS